MKTTRKEFLSSGHKTVTLLGMSGVGKTTLANRLPKDSWFHYSGDYRIGTKYLEEPILDNIKGQAMQVEFLRDLLRSDSIYIRSNITVHNLAPISTFLGKIGNPALGGLNLAEFRRRQDLHREAEIGAMLDVAAFIEKGRHIYGYPHFVNDAGGSVCELGDERAISSLAANTVIVYLKADAALEQQLIERQHASPKPLYYQTGFFNQQLQEYLTTYSLNGPEEVNPDAFVQWIFPRLIAHRNPLYEAIADKYGYTIEAQDIENVRDEKDFVELLAAVLD